MLFAHTLTFFSFCFSGRSIHFFFFSMISNWCDIRKHKICTHWLVYVLATIKMKSKKTQHWSICSFHHLLTKPHTFKLWIIVDKSCDNFQLKFMTSGRSMEKKTKKKKRMKIVLWMPSFLFNFLFHCPLGRHLFILQCCKFWNAIIFHLI